MGEARISGILHNEYRRENYMKQYRSNIVSLINIMGARMFNKEHISALEKTSFGYCSNLFGTNKWC